MEVVYSRRRRAVDFGEFDRKSGKIYIYLIPHLREARDVKDLALMLGDTFMHEYLHYLLPEAKEKAIEFAMMLIHKVLGFE